MNKRKSFEIFLNENLDSIYRFAYTYMCRREEAEDVVSESVVKALRCIDKLKNISALKCWFYSIVANTALSELRSRAKFTDAEPDEEGREDDYSRLNFESMIRLLDEQSKAVVVLKCCDDMTFGEISQVLGINENTAKTRFYTAVKKLRREILE